MNPHLINSITEQLPEVIQYIAIGYPKLKKNVLLLASNLLKFIHAFLQSIQTCYPETTASNINYLSYPILFDTGSPDIRYNFVLTKEIKERFAAQRHVYSNTIVRELYRFDSLSSNILEEKIDSYIINRIIDTTYIVLHMKASYLVRKGVDGAPSLNADFLMKLLHL